MDANAELEESIAAEKVLGSLYHGKFFGGDGLAVNETEAKQANDGLLHVGRFICLESSRISALVSSAARRGLFMPSSVIACRPGR